VLAESKAMVKIVGESLNETIIQYDDFAQRKTSSEKKRELQDHQAFMCLVMSFRHKISLSKIPRSSGSGGCSLGKRRQGTVQKL
jgi:hypothetical protein